MDAAEDPDRWMDEPELHGKGCFLPEEHEDSQNKLLQPQPDWARKSTEKDKDAWKSPSVFRNTK